MAQLCEAERRTDNQQNTQRTARNAASSPLVQGGGVWGGLSVFHGRLTHGAGRLDVKQALGSYRLVSCRASLVSTGGANQEQLAREPSLDLVRDDRAQGALQLLEAALSEASNRRGLFGPQNTVQGTRPVVPSPHE